MPKNLSKMEQEFAQSNLALRTLRIITPKDVIENLGWKTLRNYYKQAKSLSWVTRAAVTLQNSVLHQGRRVFFLTQKTFRELLDQDTNHTELLGMRNENYAALKKYLLDLKICKKIDEIRTSKGNYVEVYEVIDEELLSFLGNVDAKAQHQEILDKFTVYKHKPKKTSAEITTAPSKSKQERVATYSSQELDEDDTLAQEGYLDPISPRPMIFDRSITELLDIDDSAEPDRDWRYKDDKDFKTNEELDIITAQQKAFVVQNGLLNRLTTKQAQQLMQMIENEIFVDYGEFQEHLIEILERGIRNGLLEAMTKANNEFKAQSVA